MSVSAIPLSRPARWAETELSVPPRSYWDEVRGRLRRDRMALASLGLLALVGGAALAAPLLALPDPLQGDVAARLQPLGSPTHALGTDEQGRDMLSRLLYGGRLSLLTGIVPVLVATFLGTLAGAVAAYVGRAPGALLMRIMDMSYAFPAVLLAIAVTASLGPGVVNSIIALSIVFVPPISRVAESATRQVIVQEHIEAARLSGASTLEVVRDQIIPNVFSPIFIYAASLIGLSIIIASGLSFLGLGAAPPTPEWGAMLNSLRGSIYVQPAIVALPGVLIFLTSIAFNLFSSSLRDALDIKAA